MAHKFESTTVTFAGMTMDELGKLLDNYNVSSFYVDSEVLPINEKAAETKQETKVDKKEKAEEAVFPEVEKEVVKAKPKQKEKVEEKVEEKDSSSEARFHYNKMKLVDLRNLIEERGLDVRSVKKQPLIDALIEDDKKGTSSEEIADADETKETDVSEYDGIKAPVLFKMAKERGLDVKPKQKAKYYVDLLEEADAQEADEDDEWEETEDVADTDEWDEVEEELDDLTDDEDDEWDI